MSFLRHQCNKEVSLYASMTLFSLLILFCSSAVTIASANFCTASLCQLCCRATQEGCVNAFPSYAKGALISNHLACEQCNCDNPQIGCGWVGRHFKRIECTSCNLIEAMLESNPGLAIAGCGSTVVDGALVYTS